MFLILALVVIGISAGWAAQLILGTSMRNVNWNEAFVSGVLGSFVGGLIFSLIAGDGFDLRVSGLLGSVIGAVIVLSGWRAIRKN
jgi:uncharacterized membrane protein YeaQ/YmgE (transglycosylase-associated protein family)